MEDVIPTPADEENIQATKKLDELNAYLKSVTGTDKGDDTLGSYFHKLVQKDIGKVIEVVMQNHQRRPSYVRVLGRYSMLIIVFAIALMVCGTVYLWSMTHEPVMSLYAGEVLAVTGLCRLFKWMNKVAVQIAPVTALIVLLYKFMTFYLFAVLLLLSFLMAADEINIPPIIVLLCAVAVILVLMQALAMRDKKDLSSGPGSDEGFCLSDVINDPDEKLLCANPFIKEWIAVVIERRDTLTYSLLNNCRASILKFAEEIMALHKK